MPTPYREFVVEYGLRRITERPPEGLPRGVRENLLKGVVNLRSGTKTVPIRPESLPKMQREKVLQQVHQDYREQVLHAIDSMRNYRRVLVAIGAPPDGFLVSQPLPRLYGPRQEIIDAVAADWGVSRRTVRAIWEKGEPDTDF